MITPAPLGKNDKVAIVSPAGKIVQGSLSQAVSIVESWGFRAVLGDNVYSAAGYFAGNDQQRTSDFQLALDDPEVKAIICSRGGYGSVRIIDKLDFSKFLLYPKWIIGYSDITIFHSHINTLCGIETIHAPMALEFESSQNCIGSNPLLLLKTIIEGGSPDYSISHNIMNRVGVRRGVLIGGNISVLVSLLGSKSMPDMRGKILFIEEVGEYLYHLDRMVNALKRAGVFEKLSGLIVGKISAMKDGENGFGSNFYEIIAGALSDYDFPVLFDFPAGHQPENLPLIFGREVDLRVGINGAEINFG